MSETLRHVIGLIQNGDVRISAHGYDEMVADGIAGPGDGEGASGVQGAGGGRLTLPTRGSPGTTGP